MSLLGWGVAGATGLGPTELFNLLPFAGYRDLLTDFSRGWMQEFLDAAGFPFDSAAARFANPAARAALLDPASAITYPADANQADRDTAPTNAAAADTVLDLLCYLVGVPTPINTNFSTATKKRLVAVGWELLRYKGTRLALLRMASAITSSGVAYGRTTPGWSFGMAIPDGEPDPGWGGWVPGTTSATATQRPWIFDAINTYARTRLQPAWNYGGVGYSQFRAGYSAAGEPAFTSGARLSTISNGSFSAWTAGVPDGWTKTGAGTLTQSTAATQTNWEFTDYAAVFALGAAAAGVGVELSQASVRVNNQVTHRLEIDYAYRQTPPAPAVSKLSARLYDEENATYYNPTTETWGTAVYEIPLPPGDSASARTRYGIDVNFTAGELTLTGGAVTTNLFGTRSVTLYVSATSDGTASSQLAYILFRAELMEKYDQDIEEAAGGERTLWLPLRDSLGWSSVSHGGGGANVLEPATYDRGNLKQFGGSVATFDYHPALSGRAYRSRSQWTNVLLGSNDFNETGADWTASGPFTLTYDTTRNPYGVAASSPTLARTGAAAVALYERPLNIAGAGEAYVSGVWVKNLGMATITSTGTVSTTLASRTVTGSGTNFTAGCVGAEIVIGSNTYVVSAVASTTSLTITEPAIVSVAASAFSINACDVTLQVSAVGGVTSRSITYSLTQAQGWQLLVVPSVAFAAGDIGFPLEFRVSWGSSQATGSISVYSAYCYAVTGRTGVLYPPVCVSPAGATGYVSASTTTATVSGANLHPLMLHPVSPLSSGALNFTIVPTFSGLSQPNQTLVDLGESLIVNRLVVRVVSGALEATLIDDGGTARTASIALIEQGTPTAGQMTWIRDTQIDVNVRWSAATGIAIGAGNGHAQYATGVPWTVDSASLAGIGIGNNFTGGAGQFDGLIRDVEFLRVG